MHLSFFYSKMQTFQYINGLKSNGTLKDNSSTTNLEWNPKRQHYRVKMPVYIDNCTSELGGVAEEGGSGVPSSSQFMPRSKFCKKGGLRKLGRKTENFHAQRRVRRKLLENALFGRARRKRDHFLNFPPKNALQDLILKYLFSPHSSRYIKLLFLG